MGLLFNNRDGIVQQPGLIFYSWGSGHDDVQFGMRARGPVKLKQLSLELCEDVLELGGAGCQ